MLSNGTENTGAFITGTASILFSEGTQVLNGTTTLAGLNFNISGGTISGPGDLVVNGNLTWSNSTIMGSGGLDVTAASTLTINTSSQHVLSRTINNSGVTNFAGGSLTLSGGTFNNLAGGIVNITETNFSGVFGGSGSLAIVNNAGLMNINSGSVLTLQSTGGGSISFVDSGTINAMTPLIIGGGTFNTGAIITGSASVELDSSNNVGTIQLNDTLNLNAATVSLNFSTVTGPGNLDVNRNFAFNEGTISGTGA